MEARPIREFRFLHEHHIFLKSLNTSCVSINNKANFTGMFEILQKRKWEFGAYPSLAKRSFVRGWRYMLEVEIADKDSQYSTRSPTLHCADGVKCCTYPVSKRAESHLP